MIDGHQITSDPWSVRLPCKAKLFQGWCIFCLLLSGSSPSYTLPVPPILSIFTRISTQAAHHPFPSGSSYLPRRLSHTLREHLTSDTDRPAGHISGIRSSNRKHTVLRMQAKLSAQQLGQLNGRKSARACQLIVRSSPESTASSWAPPPKSAISTVHRLISEKGAVFIPGASLFCVGVSFMTCHAILFSLILHGHHRVLRCSVCKGDGEGRA
jgi:hypothetical protein